MWWWHNFKVWWQVQKYLHYQEQLGEWQSRYVADTEKTERKKERNIDWCLLVMEEALYKLTYDLKLTRDTWIYLGHGQEVRLSLVDELPVLEVRYV